MAGVFVSYRRDDSQGFAGRLADDLTDILGDEAVFRDIEIPVGSDFTDVLHRAIAASDALLVVIGRGWVQRGPGGYGDRLFEPTDWVRTEIEAALAQRKHLVPVLTGGARMPAADELPQSIRQLCVLQAAELTDRHWDEEVELLADRLRTLCPGLDTATGTVTRPVHHRGESPADVMRDIGERLLDEVVHRRRPRITPPAMPPTLTTRAFGAIARGLRRVVVTALLVAAVYIGLRLFGDDEVLRGLDRFEARLLVGWERLQQYLARR